MSPIILKLMRMLAEQEAQHLIDWDTDLNFYVNCNDAFFWATCDAEPVATEGDIDLLQECLAVSSTDGALLYCARKRGMRPQGAMYAHIEQRLWSFFNSCGPEREIAFGNPNTPEQALKVFQART